jgi:hypothetical protein
MWKSADRAPSLRALPWHLPYYWWKSTENLSQVKKNLRVQYTYYQNTHTLQNSHTHTHITKQYKTTTVQIKTQYKIYPNEIVTL